MFLMISGVAELRAVKSLSTMSSASWTKEASRSTDDVKVIRIEMPSAAPRLLARCDFFSTARTTSSSTRWP
jgi:phosphoenolpyruvate-protein kinase (PTS system EI component)